MIAKAKTEVVNGARKGGNSPETSDAGEGATPRATPGAVPSAGLDADPSATSAASTDTPPSEAPKREPTTVRTFRSKKQRGQPITMITAYDYPTAQLAEAGGVDSILVGDSLAMVVLGHENTLTVTMDEMLHHCRAVKRGASLPLLIGDMPFMSYQGDVHQALHNAGRFLKEGGMDAVKLEGGAEVCPQIRLMVSAGIPVMGHVGLTPQSIHALGGWRVQGRDVDGAERMLSDALALQAAGCFAIVLESVPDRLATLITERLDIPTIGIGAGTGTSGQVLVIHDLLGLFDRFQPKFVKRYAMLGAAARAAIRDYVDEVGALAFPGPEHIYSMSDAAWQELLERVGGEGGGA